MTRNETILVLQKALDLLNKPTPSTSRASCRGPSVEQEAKNVLRALTGDPTIGSSSEDSHQSPMKGQAADDLYCEEKVVVTGTNRRISLDTMERILDMYEDHCSERTIKAKYRCTIENISIGSEGQSPQMETAIRSVRRSRTTSRSK